VKVITKFQYRVHLTDSVEKRLRLLGRLCGVVKSVSEQSSEDTLDRLASKLHEQAQMALDGAKRIQHIYETSSWNTTYLRLENIVGTMSQDLHSMQMVFGSGKELASECVAKQIKIGTMPPSTRQGFPAPGCGMWTELVTEPGEAGIDEHWGQSAEKAARALGKLGLHLL
jgi:hypothetical protein